ncbi:hypothetical protein BDK51DRAFT_39421 [Blyttiomyces helicus]|uniref:Uncharacterized protein n=1 Tax=Blyttiomyces helicus TaxID=388810 RepID=A0A4P9WK52_9FUNG|nr:hypothetical protein BDK51DRAFT_39421 [Blyttiomyces helicus]|eukprot:RKO93349.1 hypothetical protein BDK51DRAFT_39421 [Blyttiomyces helicus]
MIETVVPAYPATTRQELDDLVKAASIAHTAGKKNHQMHHRNNKKQGDPETLESSELVKKTESKLKTAEERDPKIAGPKHRCTSSVSPPRLAHPRHDGGAMQHSSAVHEVETENFEAWHDEARKTLHEGKNTSARFRKIREAARSKPDTTSDELNEAAGGTDGARGDEEIQDMRSGEVIPNPSRASAVPHSATPSGSPPSSYPELRPPFPRGLSPPVVAGVPVPLLGCNSAAPALRAAAPAKSIAIHHALHPILPPSDLIYPHPQTFSLESYPQNPTPLRAPQEFLLRGTLANAALSRASTPRPSPSSIPLSAWSVEVPPTLAGPPQMDAMGKWPRVIPHLPETVDLDPPYTYLVPAGSGAILLQGWGALAESAYEAWYNGSRGSSSHLPTVRDGIHVPNNPPSRGAHARLDAPSIQRPPLNFDPRRPPSFTRH